MNQKNIIEKIWERHVVAQQEGHPAVLAVDTTWLHELSSAQAFSVLKERHLPVYDPARCFATIDHSIPTRSDRRIFYDKDAEKQIELFRQNVKEQGIQLFDLDSQRQGVVHVVGPELGLTQPGLTIACGDSHTSTHGAFGAFGFGVGSSELAFVLATGCLLMHPPKTMRVCFEGQLQKGVFAKDLIMKLIAEIGIGGANGHVIEYVGEIVQSFSMAERMTLCNMSIECGARASLIAPDEVTFEYLKNCPFSPENTKWERAVEEWQLLRSDPDCHYDRDITITISQLKPMVSWGINPAQAIEIDQPIPHSTQEQPTVVRRALDYMGLQEKVLIADTPIDWAFVGSCTNSRIEDMRIVAQILKGRRVCDTVTFYIVPGSESVLAQIREEGLDRIFTEAGAQLRMPGCSMCMAVNEDKVPPGKRCISSTNRNFIGRQGPGSRTHLASPATVAASAVAGKIVSPVSYLEELEENENA